MEEMSNKSEGSVILSPQTGRRMSAKDKRLAETEYGYPGMGGVQSTRSRLASHRPSTAGDALVSVGVQG